MGLTFFQPCAYILILHRFCNNLVEKILTQKGENNQDKYEDCRRVFDVISESP